MEKAGEDVNHNDPHLTNNGELKPRVELNKSGDVNSDSLDVNSPKTLKSDLGVKNTTLESTGAGPGNNDDFFVENEASESLDVVQPDYDQSNKSSEYSLIDKVSADENETDQFERESQDVIKSDQSQSSAQPDQWQESSETSQSQDPSDAQSTDESQNVHGIGHGQDNCSESNDPSDCGLNSVECNNSSTFDTVDEFYHTQGDTECQKLSSFDIGPSGEKIDSSSCVNISLAVVATEDAGLTGSENQCNSSSANDSANSSANISTVYTDDEPSRTTAEFVSCGNEDSAVSFDGPVIDNSSNISLDTPKSEKCDFSSEFETCSNVEEMAAAMVDNLLKPDSMCSVKTEGFDSSTTGVYITAEQPPPGESDAEFFSDDQKFSVVVPENDLDKTPEKVTINTDATNGATTNLVNNANDDLVISAGSGTGAAGDLDEAILNEENMRKVNEIYKQIKESVPPQGGGLLQRTQSMLTDVTVTNLSTYANASTSDVGDIEDLPDEAPPDGGPDEPLPHFRGDRVDRQMGDTEVLKEEDCLQFDASSTPSVRFLNPSGAEMVTGLEEKETMEIEEVVDTLNESLADVKEDSTVVEEDTTGVEERDNGEETREVGEVNYEEDECETENRNSRVGVWNDILGTGALKKKIMRIGYGEGTKPQKGEVVTVKYSLSRVDTGLKIVHDVRLDFVLGDCDVIDALDLGVQLMEMNEHCIMFSSSRFAFGEKGYEPTEEKAETAHDLRGWPTVKIEPNVDVELDIELLNSKQLPADYALYTPDQLTDALQKKKEKGNFYSRRREWEKSMSGYNQALKVLLAAEESSILPEEDVRSWKIALYNNMAYTQLSTELYREAIVSCDFTLEADPENVKALYRKAKAFEGLGDTGDALEVIKTARRLDPRSKEITLCWEQLKEKHKLNQQKEKDVYRKMMEPMSSLADTDGQSKATIEQSDAKCSASSSAFSLRRAELFVAVIVVLVAVVLGVVVSYVYVIQRGVIHSSNTPIQGINLDPNDGASAQPEGPV